MCFLPREAKAREIVVKQFEHFIKLEGQVLLGWRDVPTDPAGLGKTVLDGMPLIRQAIVAMGPNTRDEDAFERKLLTIRKHTENPLEALAKKHKQPAINQLYMPRFSARTVVYKGLLLAHERVASIATCRIRSPSRLRWCISVSPPTRSRVWKLAHPYRYNRP